MVGGGGGGVLEGPCLGVGTESKPWPGGSRQKLLALVPDLSRLWAGTENHLEMWLGGSPACHGCCGCFLRRVGRKLFLY